MFVGSRISPNAMKALLRLLSCLVLAVVVSSCEDSASVTLPEEEIPTIYASDFFPTSTGDTYTFEALYVDYDILVYRDTVSYTVGGPVDLGGKAFIQYIPIADNRSIPRWRDTLYYRVSGGSVYRWLEDHEEIFVDLSRPHQKTDSLMFPLLFLDSIPSIKVKDSQFNNCIRVQGGGEEVSTVSFAKDIGMISWRIPDPDLTRHEELRLLSAQVGGKAIP
jgi:hypothetical protein